jgi:hypothetical protein
VINLIERIGTILPYVCDGLGLILFVLAIRKRVYRVLIFLATYITLLLPHMLAWSYLSHTRYFWTVWASYTYFISDAVLNFLRLLIIVEIGIRTLRGYPAVWHFAWRILSLIGSGLILWGTVTATRHVHPTQLLFLTIQGFLNGTQAVILLIILAIGLYYRVDVPKLFQLIVIGICILSAAQVFTSELGRYVTNPTNSSFDLIQRYSFATMLVIWTVALRKWPGGAHPQQRLISQEQYDELSPQVHDRLRELNDRLAELKKY